MKTISLLFVCALGAACLPGLVAADRQLTIVAGKSIVLDSPGDVERVAVATEDVLEAVAVTQREVILNGKAPGETTVIIWQHNGGRQSYDVDVIPSPSKLEALRRQLHDEVGDSVQVEQEDKNVIVRGSVKTQLQGDRALALVASLGRPVNLLMVDTPPERPQILLKVRFAAVDRSSSLALGANIFSTGAGKTVGSVTTQQFSAPTPGSIGSGSSAFSLSNALNLFLFRPDLNLGATIEALEAQNLLQILAEPNVLATDGKQASFLAGGEFPYPVVQSSVNGISNVTIQFREFGIRLNFTPTITPRGTIHLEVAPEVSALDYTNGLTYQGFNIPGLSVRRVKTEVEINNDQSFAIAGLLDNTVTDQLSKVPGLGDIPLFGKLFQSRSVTKNNTELLVVVTPELVQPIPAGGNPPNITMPKPFLKDAPEVVPGGNPADTRQAPSAAQIPFEPSADIKAGAPAAPPVPLADAANSFRLPK